MGKSRRKFLTGLAGASLGTTRFDSMYRRGEEVEITRVSPVAPEATVAPNAPLWFEIAVEQQLNGPIDTTWYIDGEEETGFRKAVGPLHGEFKSNGRAVLRNTFETVGTYEIAVEIFESREKETELGRKRWTLHVDSEGNTPPIAERISPWRAEVPLEKETEFTLRAVDPDGQLSHANWWIGICDAYVETTPLSGIEDTASVSMTPKDPQCGLHAWIIDKQGVRNMSEGWSFGT